LRKNRRHQGSALLLFVLFLAIAVGGLSVALFEEQKASTRDVLRAEADLRALEIAETGIAVAESEIMAGIDVDGDGLGVVRRSFGGGLFSVDAVHSGADWTLVSTARLERAQRIVEQGLGAAKATVFNSVIFSNGAITFSGSAQTDSFDSRTGDYASQAVNSDFGGVYAGVAGTVGSNAGISLSGSPAIVRGHAIPGPVSSVDFTGNSAVTGSTTARGSKLDLDAPSITEFGTAWLFNDNAKRTGNASYNPVTKELKVEGGSTLTLPEGTYFFSKITLTGGSKLKTQGKVTIYNTQGIDATGGSVQNTSATASNLSIVVYPYSFPSGALVPKPALKFTGGSESYMTIYAPKSPLSISSGDVYGSFVVGSASISGSAFVHYDEALATTPESAPLEETYWTERRTTARQP
jgi:hypothetical protein